MNLSAYSIRNPIPAILLFILLTLAGLIGFNKMTVQDFPDIELPMVTVNAVLQGSAPAQLETEVARKLENSIATLPGVKHIYTTINDGSVTLIVEFVLEKASNEAVEDVRSAVSRVRSDLPRDLQEPTITKASTAGRPVLIYTLAAQGLDEQSLSWLVDNRITKRLLAVNGVGAIRRIGGLSREVQIILDPDRMRALQVSAADVSRRLRQVQQESPGGRGDVGGVEQSVRTIATLQTAEELARLDIPLANGQSLRLDQVAQVRDTNAERRSMALLNGRPVIGFEIMRTKGAGELDVQRGVRQAVQELQQHDPKLEFHEAVNNASPVQEGFDASMMLLYEGALLAVVVVWWFLRDWRATLISAAALPLSVIPAFLGMYWFGFTLNTVTLLSMALVVGILVDDAIVEVENIARHLRMGKTPFQAAMEAADEIGLAVIATTFALVAVFLPTAFMDGIPGKFFKSFGWTAVLAILASLVVARLLTPMMAAYILKPTAKTDEREGWMMRLYMRAMQWALRHRLLSVLGALLFFAASLLLVPFLPKGFVPPADRAQTLVNVELPPGSTLAETLRASEAVRQKLQKLPAVKSVFSSVGGGASGDVFAMGVAAEVRKAVLTVQLTHHRERHVNQQALEVDIRAALADLPGMRLTVGPQDTGVKMQLVLQSEDAEALTAAAKAVEKDLRTLQGVGNVSSSASLVRPEIIIRPDFALAADLGVTTESIGDTVRVATAGDYDVGLPKLNLSERQVPIRVKLPNSVRADLAQLAQLQVPGRLGPVSLGQVAQLSINSGPAEISRLDRSRNVTLDLELGTRELGEVYAEAMQLPSLKNLPAGVSLAQLGDAQEMEKLFNSFALAMGIGILCIFMVLVLLFHDFLQPVTILAALPLSIGGAFVLLLLTGKSFSMPSLIGLLMLMGIATKNSILLVEYAIVARREGLSRFESLVDACRKRARPIVMTTIAMGAGMLPIAMGMGADPSFRSPMAIAVIGGLITSTLLSLLVIPVVFACVDDVAQWLRRLRSGRGPAA